MLKILSKYERRLLHGGILAVLWLMTGCISASDGDPSSLSDPPEITIGERLFLETRFAEFFAAHSGSDVNKSLPLGQGDPIMDETVTTGDPLPGPFRNKTMNCRSCHLVDEQFETPDGGMRTYTDFARRSPIPDRTDGLAVSSRNSPPLVNATLARTGVDLFLHFDGEFTTADDLVRDTLTGRNFGWLASEHSQAVAHIARIVREDNGKDPLGAEFGSFSYTTLFSGTDPNLPETLRLPPAFQLDVQTATDQQVLDAVAKLISAYVDGLRFSKNQAGEYNASPYDTFLAKNHLPRQPDPLESELDYSRRLLQSVEALGSPEFVAHDGSFETHTQQFIFGAKELQGLKIYFREGTSPLSTGVGNCIACHAAPNFTDFRFHNTAVTQREYDQLHGTGTFMALTIPDLTTRQAAPDVYLPPTPAHPNATGKFRTVPSATDPEKTDLGLWNVFANGDFPTPQSGLFDFLCDTFGTLVTCTEENLLPFAIAYFKTPTLRDLGHSSPYMHNGQFGALADVVEHYRIASDLARGSAVRNTSVELAGIRLSPQDTDAVVHFLEALNEDYE